MSDRRPAVTLTYCTQCNWMLRTAWMAQELLSTFGQDIGSVTLVPGTGGIFTISVDGEQVWDRKAIGGFPDVKQLKQILRDRVWPERDLGHVDR
jgi:selenoprotein W-related protein